MAKDCVEIASQKNKMETTFELYNGRVKGKFLGPSEDKPNRHMYFIDGVRKRGVTTILGIKDKSTALVSWSQEETAKQLLRLIEDGVKIGEKEIVDAVYSSDSEKEKAANLGSDIHSWIEQYIKNKLKVRGYEKAPEMPDDPNVVVGASSFLKWESEHKVKFLWSEKVLYSKKYDYIGTGDFGAKVDGEICLCDIKTGNGMYNSVLAQTAAYVYADTEESGQKYEGRWAIRIAKETESEYIKRMTLKNKIKRMLGKKESEIEPYKVFDAKYLDNEKRNMKRDFEGFLSHLSLSEWDKETDFYAEKQRNGKIR